MNILKIAFFSIIFLASGATIYFLDSYKSELEIILADLDTTSKNNVKLAKNQSQLETKNAELEVSIADIKVDEKLTLEKVTDVNAQLAGTSAELKALIAKAKDEQLQAKSILDQLAEYKDNASKISKLERYSAQITDLNEELQDTQAKVAAATAVNQSLVAVNETNELIINLFKTSTVMEDFKAQVTEIVPNWKVVLLDAGFHEDRLSPNTKLTVVRDGKKIADLVVSRVAKDKAVASVEKYYTVTNDLGETQEAQIAIGDRVVGANSEDAA